MGLLIDSTLLVTAERRRQSVDQLIYALLDEFGDVELGVSVMSAGELFHCCWRADSPARRARREEFVEAFLAAVPVVPLTLQAMRIFGEIDARLSEAGNRVPTSDLLIACTALSRADEIVTGSLRHFGRVPGLVVREW